MSWLLFASVGGYFSRSLHRRSQLHSHQPAHAALFHCYSVENVGFGNGAFVVRDDDELALFYKTLQHADKTVDVAFVHCRIDFIENTERTRPHHVNGEQQRYRDHGPFASAQQGDALQLFAGRLGGDFDSAVERIVFVQQRQVCAPAPEEFSEHFAEIGSDLGKGFTKQLSGGRVDLRNHIEQLAARICQVSILRFEKFVSLFQLIVFMNSVEVHRTHVVELGAKIGNQFLKICFCKLDRVLRTRWRIRAFVAICGIRVAVDPPFRLNPQNFLKRRLINCKLAKIDVIAA